MVVRISCCNIPHSFNSSIIIKQVGKHNIHSYHVLDFFPKNFFVSALSKLDNKNYIEFAKKICKDNEKSILDDIIVNNELTDNFIIHIIQVIRIKYYIRISKCYNKNKTKPKN